MTISSNVAIASRGLRIVEAPLVRASDETLAGYGRLVTRFDDAEVQVLPWPTSGRRRLDPGTGLEGGVTVGPFKMR